MALSAVLLAVCLAGCKSTSPDTANNLDATPVHYVVIAQSTGFYKYGPAQTNGADMNLKKGTIVTLVERHYGFSRVLGPDGDAGYISTDDIMPLPNTPTAQTAMNTSKKPSTGGGSSSHRTPPDFQQPNDATLPSNQPPSDVPAPSFRY